MQTYIGIDVKECSRRRKWVICSLFCLVFMLLFSVKTVQAASADYDGAVDVLLTALDNYEQTVNLEEYNIPGTSSAISKLERIITFDYPQYVQFDYLSSAKTTTKNSATILKEITLKYKTDSAAETTKMREEYEEQISAFLSHVDADWTDFEKILYAHDWLAFYCKYGYSSYPYSAYGAIVLHKAVCEGYSCAFKDLMNRLGIECNIIQSSSHAWNIVKLNSKWYHVDVTCDTTRRKSCAQHDYLHLSETQLLNAGNSFHSKESGWTYMCSMDAGTASDTTYDNYFWSNTDAPFLFYDGYWYGLLPQSSSTIGSYQINQYRVSSNKLVLQKTILTLPADSYDSEAVADWAVDSYYGIYNSYTGFAHCGKYFYVCSPHVITCVDITSGSSTTAYELTSSEKALGYIDGITIDDDGVLTYDLVTGYDGEPIYEKNTITVHTHSYTSKVLSKGNFVESGKSLYTCSTCGDVCTKETGTVFCRKGQTYTVGNYTYKITSAKTDGTGTVAFTGLAGSVTKVTVAKTVKILGATFKVTKIADEALKNQTKITSVSVGANVKTIGSQAFYGCKKLTTVTGCSAVTSVGSKAFYKCAKLTRVGSKASRITLTRVKTIGASAFYGCTAITYVNLSSTALTEICASAFRGCTKMKTFVSKSTKLKSIGAKAFYGDKKLASFTLKTSKLTSSGIGSSAFKGIKSTCTFKVPSKKVSAYTKLFKKKGAGSKIRVKKN